MKTLILTVAILCGAAMAQTAVVVELSKSDADQAKQLYEAKIAAEKAWDEASWRILGKYTSFPGAVEFSQDFRFFVPKRNPPASALTFGNNCCSTCGVTLTGPASGMMTFDGIWK